MPFILREATPRVLGWTNSERTGSGARGTLCHTACARQCVRPHKSTSRLSPTHRPAHRWRAPAGASAATMDLAASLLAASLGSAARGAVGPAGARHEGGGSRPLAQAQRGALAAAAAQGAHRRCIFAPRPLPVRRVPPQARAQLRRARAQRVACGAPARGGSPPQPARPRAGGGRVRRLHRAPGTSQPAAPAPQGGTRCGVARWRRGGGALHNPCALPGKGCLEPAPAHSAARARCDPPPRGRIHFGSP